MKTRILRFISCSITLLCAAASSVFAQGTAFTYQGRLNDGSAPASGIYDLRFALYDAASGGGQQGLTLTTNAIAVSNGLFTVPLDFGNQFPGTALWLEIAVRTNGAVSFTTLAPRQSLSATPGYTTISWTPNTPGWVLQHSGSLSPVNWTNALSGATNPAVVAAAGPSGFYRLFKP